MREKVDNLNRKNDKLTKLIVYLRGRPKKSVNGLLDMKEKLAFISEPDSQGLIFEVTVSRNILDKARWEVESCLSTFLEAFDGFEQDNLSLDSNSYSKIKQKLVGTGEILKEMIEESQSGFFSKKPARSAQRKNTIAVCRTSR